MSESDKLRSALEAVTDLYAALFHDTYPDLDPERVAAIIDARASLAGSVEPVDGNLWERQAFVDGAKWWGGLVIRGQSFVRDAEREADRRYGKGQNDE